MKIFKLAILISFLFNSVAYSYDTLRPPMLGDKVNKVRLEFMGKLASGQNIRPESFDEAYAKIADWIIANSGYKENSLSHDARIREIIEELKAGKVILREDSDSGAARGTGETTISKEILINFRKGIVVYFSIVGTLLGDREADMSSPSVEYEYAASVDRIPQEILNIISEKLGLNVSPTVILYPYSKESCVNSRIELWKFSLSTMTGVDIEKCLCSLGRFGRSNPGLKAAIVKKLTKLQQKNPETMQIIQKKALELLEIDEPNFREALQPFIEDYIKIRDTIRQAGITDDTAECYALFDGIVNGTQNLKAISANLMPSHIARMSELRKQFGGFRIDYRFTPAVMATSSDPVYKPSSRESGEDYIYAEEAATLTPTKHEIQILPPDSAGTKLASGQNIGNKHTADLSTIELTPTLFLDTEVVANPDGFNGALAKLRTNEGNIPVVLLTEETKDSIIAKLKGIDLAGVEFRTKAELGLQGLDCDKDERVSLIEGIDKLKCIPLTSSFCETYKDLQKVRDQV